MSMNKKERAEFDAVKKAVYVARALNWSEPVERDVPVPKSGEVRGFGFNTYECRIHHILSNSSSHATGYIDNSPPNKTSSQHGISAYSTKLLALKAMRHAVEIECAEKLARIDMQIEKEKAS